MNAHIDGVSFNNDDFNQIRCQKGSEKWQTEEPLTKKSGYILGNQLYNCELLRLYLLEGFSGMGLI